MDNIKQVKAHLLNMENRKKLNMTGIDKVISSGETGIVLMSSYGGLMISGKDLKINKFNVEDGTLAIEGSIDIIKYNAPKVPVLKRIFK